MLQNIRDKAQGWIAWAIVILISVPFALWGIQSYLGIGSEPVVASVNGQEITQRQLDQRYQNFRQELRRQLGAAYRPELFNDQRMRKEVLKRMVREDVILQASHDMGLRSGDQLVRAAIMSIDAFKKDGRFDQQLYERGVRLQGLTTTGFEERVRRMLLSDQLSQAVQGSTFITEHELDETLRLENQTRDLAYFVIPAKDFVDDGAIDADTIKAYYEAHQSSFRSPEQVKLQYILLNATTAGKTLKVDDAALRGFYNSHQEKYGIPEQRRASHILIRLDKDASPAAVKAAKQKLLDLRRRAEQGEDFAELAKANSQDPGSAAKGGDLGFFGRGLMDPAFEKAAFALKPGEISEPVRSRFGLHLIKLSDIKPGRVKPFEQVRAEVEKQYRKSEGERRYFEMAERLADLSYEDPSSLDPAASTLKLEIHESGWIDRNGNGGEGVLRSPKVLAAAFSPDVLEEHNNSELIELDQEQSLVLRVVDHREASIKPLKEVREQIVNTIRSERAANKAKAEAESRLARLRAGEELASVAGDYPVTRRKGVKRSDRSLPPVLLKAVFRSPRPAADKPVPGMVAMLGGDYGLFDLLAVKDGSLEGMDLKQKQQQREQLRRRLAKAQFDHLVADLEAHADISYETPVGQKK